MSKITAIIPTCDRPKLVHEAINSILSQTIKPFEIIIVNNGRQKLILPDDILRQVTVYDILPYAGAAQARNFGAIIARGEFLAFLDDDDAWNPNYLQNVEEALAQGAGCVISRLDWIVNDKQEILKNPHGHVTVDHLLVRNPGTGGPNVVIARELFFKVGGYDPKLPPSEDKAMILEVLLAGLNVVTLPDNSVIVGKQRGEIYLTSYLKLAEGVFSIHEKIL